MATNGYENDKILEYAVLGVTFEEHPFGLVEARVFHKGEFDTRKMTAKEIFTAARANLINLPLTAKQRDERSARIDKLEKAAKKYGRMRVWYLAWQGRAWGGYNVTEAVEIKVM